MAFPGYGCAFRALLERNGAPSVEWVDISSFQLKLFVHFKNKYCWTITPDSERPQFYVVVFYSKPSTSCFVNRMWVSLDGIAIARLQKGSFGEFW